MDDQGCIPCDPQASTPVPGPVPSPGEAGRGGGRLHQVEGQGGMTRQSETTDKKERETTMNEAINIIKEWGVNGDKRMRYNMCESRGQNLSDLAGQRLHIKAYMLIETPNPETGEMQQSLKMLTDAGEYVGTRSVSFITGFLRFLACMESDACEEFEVEKQRSKQGRQYITFKA